jgi:hypothetical protein
MVDYSEPHPTAGTNTVLRWTLAPFGAIAALGLAFVATFLVFALIYGAEMEVKDSGPSVASQTVAVMSALIAWTWCGSRIAPPGQRKLALILFSAPVVLLGLVALNGLRRQSEMQASETAVAIGALLACAGILVLGVLSRFAFAQAPAAPPVVPTRTREERSRSTAGATSFGTYRQGASGTSRFADRDDLSSEPHHARPANAILRWVLAPVGAAVAFVCAIVMSFLLSSYLFGREDIMPGAVPFVLVLPIAMGGVIASAWVGAYIAPRRHRRIALIVFAVPGVLLGLVALVPIELGALPPGRILIGVGSLLASAVVFKMASHPRYSGSLAERFETFVSREKSISMGEPEPSENVAHSAVTET